jgi:hypothetical protein
MATECPDCGRRGCRDGPACEIIAERRRMQAEIERLTRELAEAKMKMGDLTEMLACHVCGDTNWIYTDSSACLVECSGCAVQSRGLIGDLERLTVERDEARAEVRAYCGEPGALDPYLPEGWRWVPAGPDDGEYWAGGHIGVSLRTLRPCLVVRRGLGSWDEPAGPLAAMRAADKAGEDEG